MAKVATPSEYRAARLSLLEKEKEAKRVQDALSAERRNLPIIEVTKPYTFTAMNETTNTPETVTLEDLFSSRRQLIIYHFMFDPSWSAGCAGCSITGDSVPPLEHLYSHSTSFVVVSRAPIEKITAFKKRMGWTFPWVSSHNSDFNYDMHVTQDENSSVPVEYNFRNKEELVARGLEYATKGEQPGTSVFYRGDGKGIGEEGKIYHTYSTFARGGEGFINTLWALDLTPLGRQDGETDWPAIGFRLRDEYKDGELAGLH